MEIIIKIGKTPENNIIKYEPKFFDDFNKNMSDIYDIILSDNVTITNCDMYLMYYINNLIMRYVVSKGKDIPSELINRIALNPENIQIIEVNDLGDEKIIQDDKGLLEGNYFDKYMKFIMDDFYKSLNYYPPSN